MGFWTTFACFGRSIIETTRQNILLIDRVGIIRKTRRIPFSDLSEITILSGADSQTAPNFLQSIGALRLGDKKSGKLTAFGYPTALVEHLAHLLRNKLGLEVELNRETGIESFFESSHDQTALDKTILDQPFPEAFEVVEFSPEKSISFRISPKGFFKGSHGLGVFAVIWNVIVVLFTVFAFWGMFSGADKISWVGILFALPFIAVGIFVFRWARKLGTKTIMVTKAHSRDRKNKRVLPGIRGRGFVLDRVGSSIHSPTSRFTRTQA